MKFKNKKTKRIINIVLLSLCLVCVLAFVIIMPKLKSLTDALSQINRDERISSDEDPSTKDTGFWNIAIFGLDSRGDNLTSNNTSDYGDKRSDCIMVVSINMETKDVKILSVYRDTYLRMMKKSFYDSDEYTYSKATHAYSYGSANLLPNNESTDAGPTFAIEMLESNFDLRIDNFVSVNFEVVSDVIDALGGVNIEVTEEEAKYINAYIDEINEITGSNSEHIIEGGTYLLDGIQATAYGRIRYTAGSDFRRTERQRTVLMLTAKKAQQASLTTLMSLVETVAPELRTDLTNDQILKLVNLATSFNLDGEDVQSGFPFEVTTDTSYVYAKNQMANIIKLHEYLYGIKDYVPSDTAREIARHINNKLGVSYAEDEIIDEDSVGTSYGNNGSDSSSYEDDSFSDNSEDLESDDVTYVEPDDQDEPVYEEPDYDEPDDEPDYDEPTEKPTARPTARPTAKPTAKPTATPEPEPEPTDTPEPEITDPPVDEGQDTSGAEQDVILDSASQ